jgi:hypothetical protein
METNQKNPAFARIMELITSRWISEPIYTAAKLGIADLLSDGRKTTGELAESTETFAPYLFRVLRALASTGIFRQTGKNCFENTPLSECLKSGSMQGIILFFLSQWHNRAWGKLYESVKTGKNAFELAHGIPAFQWLENHPEAADYYNKAQSLKIKNICEPFIHSYDFSHGHSVMDIGGNTGALMIELLKAYPHLKGTIADLGFVIKTTKKQIADNHLEKRCTVIECNFLKAIPRGSDVYVLSNILHDWDDEKCTIILENCRLAMEKGAVLLILESVIPDGDEPSVTKLLDLEVMIMGGGKERTLDEFLCLCRSTGFTLNRVIRVGENEKLLECILS